MLTREYPPHVYGGAGVHVDFLTRELARLVDVEVHCLGDAAPGRRRPLRGRSPPGGRQLGAADLRRRPGDDRRRRRLHDRPLPHLVRQPRRPPRQAAVRHPARRDVALARAAAPVEGRAARRRLPAVVVGRAHGLRGRRRRDRGRARRRAPTCSPPTRRSTRHGSMSSTTASTPTSTGPTRTSTCSTGSASTLDRPIGRLRRADHPPEGRAPPAAGRARLRSDGAARAARRRRRHAGAGRRDRRRGRRAARCPRRRALDHRQRSAAPTSARSCRTPRCSCAPRSTNRSASSTSRPWRARRRWSPATSAASPRSSPTAITGLLVHYDPTGSGERTKPASPMPSTGSSPTRSWPTAWASPVGSERTTEFGWDAAARKTLSIYESLGASR